MFLSNLLITKERICLCVEPVLSGFYGGSCSTSSPKRYETWKWNFPDLKWDAYIEEYIKFIAFVFLLHTFPSYFLVLINLYNLRNVIIT